MPNFKSVAISFLVLGVGGLGGCAVDDSVAPEGKGGAAGTISAGTAGKVGSGGPTTSAGGRAGSFGVAGSGGSTGGGAGSIGGNAGEGGSAGAGGRAGTAGSGGSSGAGGAKDAAIDTGADTKPSEAGPPDVVAPDDVMAEPACPAESDSQFCARSHKNCGSFLGVDNCGTSRRALACGTCVGVCGGSGTLNVCSGTEPVNRAQGGTVLSTNPSSPPFPATENDAKVFDNDIATKWYVRGNPTPSIIYDFAGATSYAINAYTVTSGNDSPDRDPASWRLEGSNSTNLSTWTTVDTRTGQTFLGRGQTNYYSFANTTGYLVYRFIVTANNGGTANGGEFQMAEIQLFGDSTTPPPDEGGTDAAPETSVDASDASSAADAGTDSSME
jgi:hypothetical protein